MRIHRQIDYFTTNYNFGQIVIKGDKLIIQSIEIQGYLCINERDGESCLVRRHEFGKEIPDDLINPNRYTAYMTESVEIKVFVIDANERRYSKWMCISWLQKETHTYLVSPRTELRRKCNPIGLLFNQLTLNRLSHAYCFGNS